MFPSVLEKLLWRSFSSKFWMSVYTLFDICNCSFSDFLLSLHIWFRRFSISGMCEEFQCNCHWNFVSFEKFSLTCLSLLILPPEIQNDLHLQLGNSVGVRFWFISRFLPSHTLVYEVVLVFCFVCFPDFISCFDSFDCFFLDNNKKIFPLSRFSSLFSVGMFRFVPLKFNN